MTCFSFGCAAGDLLIGRPCEASAADPDWAVKSERVARTRDPLLGKQMLSSLHYADIVFPPDVTDSEDTGVGWEAPSLSGTRSLSAASARRVRSG